MSIVSIELRVNGCSFHGSSASRRIQPTVMTCGPALSGTRALRRLSISSPATVGFVRWAM